MQDYDQKELGAYYTPPGLAKRLTEAALSAFLVQEINMVTGFQFDSLDDIITSHKKSPIKKLDQVTREITVLDGAVGDGQFLLAALDFLSQTREAINQYILPDRAPIGEIRTEIVQSNLFGMDIAPSALQQCHANLVSAINEVDLPEEIYRGKILQSNLVQGNFLESTLRDWSILGGVKGVDVVLGNPPWGREMLQAEEKGRLKKKFKIQSPLRNLNVFEVFVYQASRLLRSRGILAFLLPKNFTRSNHYTSLREFILDTYQILSLDFFELFQNVTQEFVSLLARKTLQIPSDHIILVDKTNRIPQVFYKQSVDHIYSREYNSELQHLLQVITHDAQPLSHFITIRRGEELSKKGTVMYCPHCDGWVPYSSRKRTVICPRCAHTLLKSQLQLYHLIQSTADTDHTQPLLTGQSFDEFNIHSTQFFDDDTPFYSKKNPQIYESPKLVFQKIKPVPCAAYDPASHRTTQNVYNLQLKPDHTGHPDLLFYILAILNSSLIHWYYEWQFNLGSKYTNAISIRNLRRLPLKSADLQEGTGLNIVDVSKRLTTTPASSPSLNRLREELNAVVLHHFGLSETPLPFT